MIYLTWYMIPIANSIYLAHRNSLNLSKMQIMEIVVAQLCTPEHINQYSHGIMANMYDTLHTVSAHYLSCDYIKTIPTSQPSVLG